MSESSEKKVLQLKVHLESVSPMVWRRIHVLEETTIAHLHGIIQVAMGWANTNLHTFKIFNESYGIPYSGCTGFYDNPKEVRLSNFNFHANDKCYYEYNFFGDCPWTLQIRIEKILPVNPKKKYPLCTGGKLACPTDSMDTVKEYIYARDLFNSPASSLIEIMRIWEMTGYCWSPKIFNKSVINQELMNEGIKWMPQKDRLFPCMEEGCFQEEYWVQGVNIKIIHELYNFLLESGVNFDDDNESVQESIVHLLGKAVVQAAE